MRSSIVRTSHSLHRTSHAIQQAPCTHQVAGRHVHVAAAAAAAAAAGAAPLLAPKVGVRRDGTGALWTGPNTNVRASRQGRGAGRQQEAHAGRPERQPCSLRPSLQLSPPPLPPAPLHTAGALQPSNKLAPLAPLALPPRPAPLTQPPTQPTWNWLSRCCFSYSLSALSRPWKAEEEMDLALPNRCGR